MAAMARFRWLLLAVIFEAERINEMFKLKRAYDEPETADGARYLVDRLWP
jgi:hypothetical protein